MRGISTLNLLLKGSVLAFLSVCSSSAFSQTESPVPNLNTKPQAACEPTTSETTCPNITEYFEGPNGGGDAAGFDSEEGDFKLFGANGPRSQRDYVLKSSGIGNDPSKVLYSPYFDNNRSTQVDYAFEISGPADITSFSVYIQSESSQMYYPICTGDIELNTSAETKVCGTAPVSFSIQGRFRLVFVFELEGENNQTISIHSFGSTIFTAGASLPVTYTGVHGKKVARGVQVTWNVADEINVSRYEVQKGGSAGGLKTIGIVFAGEKTSYSFTDEQPSTGVSYYRIKSVDIDGKFKYSTVISFSNDKSVAVMRAFPMPARNQVTLQHGTIDGKAQISISSEDGRIVKRVIPSVGSMQTAIDLSGLKAGLYLLRLENSNGEVETLKLVKQ